VQNDLGRAATVQLFSATKGQGVDAARTRLKALLEGEATQHRQV
jgi:hypothetical protein